jgi:hypothetical protein
MKLVVQDVTDILLIKAAIDRAITDGLDFTGRFAIISKLIEDAQKEKPVNAWSN